MLELKKSLKSRKISYKMYKIFFPFSFSFPIENEKKTNPPFVPHFGGVIEMPPYLKTLFEQKTEI